MSRLSRALGFGNGGEKRPRATADSPKVRRIRETMRWRGYDLSEYTDEQIAAVSSRFPNDISEDGETTEDGRRALAAALERGDFAAPPPMSPRPMPQAEPEAASTSAAEASAPTEPTAAADSSLRASLGMPTLTERLAHVFGVHAWRAVGGEDASQMRCVGCGQLRNSPIPFRMPPPTPPPSAGAPPPEEEPPSRSETFTPLDALPGVEDRDPMRERSGAPRPQQPESPLQFLAGLPWWSKLLGIFILIQVIGFIVSQVGGS